MSLKTTIFAGFWNFPRFFYARNMWDKRTRNIKTLKKSGLERCCDIFLPVIVLHLLRHLCIWKSPGIFSVFSNCFLSNLFIIWCNKVACQSNQSYVIVNRMKSCFDNTYQKQTFHFVASCPNLWWLVSSCHNSKMKHFLSQENNSRYP